MRFQPLVAQVNSPFQKMDDPGMGGDDRLRVSTKGQEGNYSNGPRRTHMTSRHKNPARVPAQLSAYSHVSSRSRMFCVSHVLVSKQNRNVPLLSNLEMSPFLL